MRAGGTTEPGRGRRAIIAVALAVLAVPVPAVLAGTASASEIRGKLVSGKSRVGSLPVSLMRAGGAGGGARLLGRAHARADGRFRLAYPAQHDAKAVLYLVAGKGSGVRLAAAVGNPRPPSDVVLNERTTAAAGFAFAQFVDGGRKISGGSPGLQNAFGMSKNLANPRTGHVGRVLRRPPNGSETSTLREFNSLSNMLPRCVRSPARCELLFALAKPRGGARPHGTLEAMADIASHPGESVRRLFKLSQGEPTPYRPALGAGQAPDAWTLGLRFDGDGTSLDGPGNIAIDADGGVWVNNNYMYEDSALTPACGSDKLFKFTPRGRFATGSPYTGGGLNGAGFGISIAPNGHVWVGNYGFAGVGCTEPVPADSVSEFRANGKPRSPSATPTSTGGWTAGPIDAPQATVPDRDGNIWIANCGNNTVTQYPGGNHHQAVVFDDLGIVSPFGIAINKHGQAFITGNASSSVAMLDPDGTPTPRSPISGGGINRPMSVAVDSRGKVWVANSGLVPFPCQPPESPAAGYGSATLLNGRGVPDPGSPFRGGGLKMPWGITVDGDDNVWVANFDGQRVGELCGTRPENCPPGKGTGDPISPPGGYGFDGLSRNTGLAIDPSGNVWLANNWIQVPFQQNPGGHEIVALVGAAAPLKTPVIGPPRR